jgi:hypothetical protein
MNYIDYKKSKDKENNPTASFIIFKCRVNRFLSPAKYASFALSLCKKFL